MYQSLFKDMIFNMEEIYKNYSQISNCSKDYPNQDQLHHYYELEMRKFNHTNDIEILEVGFGNGSFINWCKIKNYKISGYELDKNFYENAKSKFDNIYIGNENEVSKIIGKKFDLIVGFDVIEHVKKKELVNFLNDLKNSLNKNGKILIRFPNGSSVAGLEYFNADLTHYSFLNKGSLKMLCDVVGLNLVSCENMARVKKFNSLKGKLFGRLGYLIRDIIELFNGYLYHNERLPLDPNLVAVLEKQENNNV